MSVGEVNRNVSWFSDARTEFSFSGNRHKGGRNQSVCNVQCYILPTSKSG